MLICVLELVLSFLFGKSSIRSSWCEDLMMHVKWVYTNIERINPEKRKETMTSLASVGEKLCV